MLTQLIFSGLEWKYIITANIKRESQLFISTLIISLQHKREKIGRRVIFHCVVARSSAERPHNNVHMYRYVLCIQYLGKILKGGLIIMQKCGSLVACLDKGGMG